MSTAPQANDSAKKPESKAKTAARANAAAEKSAAEAKVAKVADKAPAAPRVKKPKVAKPAPRPAHSESRLAQVLIAPIVSEKATMAAEKHNQVLFKVMRDATKPEIKAAVELMFKVTVDSVQTVQHKGKTKRFGKSTGRRDHVKKAYVCLAAGQELNFSGEGA